MGFSFYEEQRITVTVTTKTISVLYCFSSGDVDSSVTFDTRDAMFCTFVTIQSFFSSTKEKDGMFYTVWQQRALFCHKPKKRFNIFRFLTIHRAFPTTKQKANFCSLFCLKERSLMINISINKPLNATRTNGSRTVLKQKFSKLLFFSSNRPCLDELLLPQLGYKRTGVRISANINLQPVFVLWI